VQELLDESSRLLNSPLATSKEDLLALIADTSMLAEQSRLAVEDASHGDRPQMRAKLTYASRAAARVQTTLGNIDRTMSEAKDNVLQQEAAEARRSRAILMPVSIMGILLILPALLYARSLDRSIWEYETELENDKNLLEQRVMARTSELQSE